MEQGKILQIVITKTRNGKYKLMSMDAKGITNSAEFFMSDSLITLIKEELENLEAPT